MLLCRLSLVLLLCATSGCFSPDFGQQAIGCGPNLECPSGLDCDTSDMICRSEVRNDVVIDGGGIDGPVLNGIDAGPDGAIDGGLEPDAYVPTAVNLEQHTGVFENGEGVYCGVQATGVHSDYALYRVFDLAGEGITGPLTVQSITVIVDRAEATDGSQAADMRLYTFKNNGGALVADNLDLVYEENLTIDDSADVPLTINNINTVVPVGAKLVVVADVPDGSVPVNKLQFGFNKQPQDGASYLSSTACAIADPTDLVGIGGLETHSWVVSIAGQY